MKTSINARVRRGARVIDLDRVRADTPACRQRIFLDSAGASLCPEPVLAEVVGHLRREAEVGGYQAALERADDLADGYRVLADLLDCEPGEIAFTDSASRAWLAAFDAVPLTAADRVLISEVEYGANLAAIQRRVAETGVRVDTVPSDESGQLSVSALRELLDERVRLVSLVHVPTNGGLVNPVAEVVEAAHEVGALVLLDACQSVGQLPVDTAELGVDLLATTGRKWLRGPRGTGVLVVRQSVADRLRPRLVDHHGSAFHPPAEFRPFPDARAYELFEHSVAARLGLIAAARYALDLGIAAIASAVTTVAEQARAGLAALPGVHVRDLGDTQCGLVTFTVDGVPAEQVCESLLDKDIIARVSPISGSPLDMRRRGLASMVRVSPHYFVSPDQVDEFLSALGGRTR